ncbi:PH domain-containing protein [Bacillus cereus]|uniref:PH domain-containing protein n=1 Tax=Bacillus TaxID=1386 RepID=UPI00094460BB|nr:MULTISPECIES: PH domain-containing protein [Bacillus cereus group]MDA1533997.1 PH domain-containing protein [Bacillus cereus group sp. TH254-2LC]MDA1545171.1 PH domain-containing protein [Bacillus cereus group sp. TH253LC]MDA1627907.1 PH domain-containing protein [Bacillus cereus group sp. TH172LC]MDA1831571.1 PH domain-containing protein [Bacillus cereus group sp. BY142LC]MDA1838859.1 PH domain-containing protein [Bacillus cereus group sp. BY17LC]
MEFPSKKDTWLYPIFFVVIGACFAPIFAGREYFLLFFTIPLAIVFIWSWFSTKYIVGEETITIRSGFVNKRIFIRDIKQISNTKNPIAAYALSFDRLEIIYGSHQTEIISPKDKEQFINLVTSKNTYIETK